MRVYQEQKLFKLPDLRDMEVLVSVHETMGPRVKVGMKAGVRVASLDDRVLPATVVAISQFPVENDREWDERLRHYVTRVRLDRRRRGSCSSCRPSSRSTPGESPTRS